MNKTIKGLERPEDLCTKGNKAYDIIVEFLEETKLTDTGGCKTFYSPKEWRERGELYCRESYLIVVYDGGDASYIFNADHEYGWCYENELIDRLNKAGLYYECGTHWYCGIYDA